ncbi:hypothetical protein H2200_008559 [Cladophialophora chaetospira]|uniref:Uncharacterized protein n=1 Tax=Cladophialophora chaetospira TaxID=386627 RepID=A0AA39CFM7_9EURO|nr:hypothetical protein H2200_008559 [Cladophialophora chaetospira]
MTVVQGPVGYFNINPRDLGLTYDIFVTTSTSSSTSSVPASTSTGAGTPTSNSSGSSRAWIAGAVLGPVILLTVLAFATFLVLRRRRKQKATKETTSATEKAQLDDTEITRKELEGAHVHEADATTARKGLSELGPPMEPAELEAVSTNRDTESSTLVSGTQRRKSF